MPENKEITISSNKDIPHDYQAQIITLLSLLLCCIPLYLLGHFAASSQFMFILCETVQLTVLITICLTFGIRNGIFIGILLPVLTYFLSGSLFLNCIPLAVPAVIISNILLCIIIGIFSSQLAFPGNRYVGVLLGILCKILVTYLLIVKYLLPYYGGNLSVPTEDLPQYMKLIRQSYSSMQYISCGIGGLLACAFYFLKSRKKHESK